MTGKRRPHEDPTCKCGPCLAFNAPSAVSIYANDPKFDSPDEAREFAERAFANAVGYIRALMVEVEIVPCAVEMAMDSGGSALVRVADHDVTGRIPVFLVDDRTVSRDSAGGTRPFAGFLDSEVAPRVR